MIEKLKCRILEKMKNMLFENRNKILTIECLTILYSYLYDLEIIFEQYETYKKLYYKFSTLEIKEVNK